MRPPGSSVVPSKHENFLKTHKKASAPPTDAVEVSAIRDIGLAPEGLTRLEWAAREMPVLGQITRRFEQERPLVGLRIGACLHVTAETANLMRTLRAGGAEVFLCASNPLSTQDDIAAALVRHCGVPVLAAHGEDTETYYRSIHAVLDRRVQITMDDGADLVTTLHRERTDLLKEVLGGTEETTTGVIRLRAMAAERALLYPIIAVNDANTKHLFDNRYGTGQSALDGIMRATNLLLAGRIVVVGGYGWCGRGIANRARGLGAQVVVTEVDPVRALEAAMDGYRVLPMDEAARIGDVFVTATGDTHVIDRDHLALMKDGAILSNAGHFDVEVNVETLRRISRGVKQARRNVECYEQSDGRNLFLIAEGRLVNLAAAEGHPAAVMDMSFANQALCVERIARSSGAWKADVHPVPADIDQEIARLKLAAMDIRIDRLTEEQQHYVASWAQGTS